MSAKPDVPEWIVNLRAAGWVNIHELVQRPRYFTGVDSFCGDWAGETLVLGKDGAPASEFRKRIEAGEADPWRHNPELPTNRMLHEALKHVGVDAPLDGSRAESCGVMYANAYYLLRDDGRFSGALPTGSQAALKQSSRVTAFILERMPRLRRIVAMGSDAYNAMCALFCIQADWRKNMIERRHVRVDGVNLVASAHLGWFGVRNREARVPRDARKRLVLEDWRAAFEA